MKPFMDEDFLLNSEPASKLYHQFAEKMPIYDYHCHLNPKDIAEDRVFNNLTEAWLEGDHYKWRAMRSNGIDESFLTGDKDPKEKFMKWAETVPKTLRNPLFHWTHLELKRYFGINSILSSETAEEIYDRATALLQTPEFSVRGLMKKMNVSLVCTTDDPIDSLVHHQRIRESGFEIKVLPTFRPDKAMAIEDPFSYNRYLKELESCSGIVITGFGSLIEAVDKRHSFFHKQGCRLADHGISTFYADSYKPMEIERLFARVVLKGEHLNDTEISQFKSAFLYEAALMNQKRGWVQQFHFGVFRNTNSRRFKEIGADKGFDSIADYPQGEAMKKFLDRLDSDNELAKTILYNLNPSDNELVATMIGNFQDGRIPGKMQFGSGWWFLDQKEGIIQQLNSLSSLGLLSRFVGMLTDSRSLLSYPRHEYFRRILCNILGEDIKNGELPEDYQLLGTMVEDICYNNAVNYFGV